MLNSIPEPFIGNPDTATLVLLNLNPGHSASDERDHACELIKAAIFRNLRHEHQEFPFYPFNPTFVGTGVAEYWRYYTATLQKDARLDDATFSQRLMVIEWLPYHPERCGLKPRIACTSQLYSWDLARQRLMKPEVQLLRTRSRKHWRMPSPNRPKCRA